MDEPPNSGIPELSAEAQEHAFTQLFEQLVTPEIEARRADGRLAEDVELVAAQVLLTAGGGKTVRLNEEVRAKALMRATRSVERGEDIRSDDIAVIEDVVLFDDDEPDAAHVTFLRTVEGWSMSFDFRYNAGRITALLTRADEFLASAESALSKGHLHSFVENAYATAELCARAELIRAPDERLLNSRTHGTTQSLYNQHAKLGNVDLRFAQLLNRLERARGGARYARGELDLEQTDARAMFGVLREMRADTEAGRPQRADRGETTDENK
jgi:HEPN domain-containing protein